MTEKEQFKPWVQDQIRKWLKLDKKVDIKAEITNLSAEFLLGFFKKHKDTKFSKEGKPENSAAHIVVYQKALNLVNNNINLSTDWVFGEYTKAAIQSFQKNNKLKGTNGIPWPQTATAMITALEKKIQPKNVEPPKVVPELPMQQAVKILAENGYHGTTTAWEYRNATHNTTIRIAWTKVEPIENKTLSKEDNEKRGVLIARITQVLNTTSTK